MTDYMKMLDEGHAVAMQLNYDEEISRLAFLGDYIFNFTTYDDEISEVFAKDMLEVIEVIMGGRNFEYLKNRSNYLKYLTMVNMPFLKDKIEWGTSVRGAWLNDYEQEKPLGLDCGRVIVRPGELKEFLTQLIEWSTK
jgi:hypothetical protein